MLRGVGGEAREGVGIREDLMSRIKIQYMFSMGKGYISYPRYHVLCIF